MKISIIGTNGFLSDALGLFCNERDYSLTMIGRSLPKKHVCKNFFNIDLATDKLPYDLIINSDIIIYAAGAGIQSNLKQTSQIVYSLNLFLPIEIYTHLNSVNFKGTFISFGSYFEIGENSINKFFSESELILSQNRVVNDYSISKRLLSRFISSFEPSFKLLHFVLPTIYGEFEATHRLIPYTIDMLKTNGSLTFTSGDQVRQYIYIKEFIQMVFMAIEKDVDQGVYNVSGAETLTVKQIVSKLFALFKIEMPENVFGKVERLDSGMKILQLDGSKLQKAIDYKPSILISNIYEKY
jgi:nucleoside-diphosphate-sugar epimerase